MAVRNIQIANVKTRTYKFAIICQHYVSQI